MHRTWRKSTQQITIYGNSCFQNPRRVRRAKDIVDRKTEAIEAGRDLCNYQDR